MFCRPDLIVYIEDSAEHVASRIEAIERQDRVHSGLPDVGEQVVEVGNLGARYEQLGGDSSCPIVHGFKIRPDYSGTAATSSTHRPSDGTSIVACVSNARPDPAVRSRSVEVAQTCPRGA